MSVGLRRETGISLPIGNCYKIKVAKPRLGQKSSEHPEEYPVSTNTILPFIRNGNMLFTRMQFHL